MSHYYSLLGTWPPLTTPSCQPKEEAVGQPSVSMGSCIQGGKKPNNVKAAERLRFPGRAESCGGPPP